LKPRITFIQPGGAQKTIEADENLSVMQIALEHKIPGIEGACGGETACSTCHVILDKAYFDKLPEQSEAEEDMLDLAFGLEKTSRLGCQIVMTPELDGLVVRLPAGSRNMMGG
jgi:2Fe-2S ferredoxin